MQGVIPTVVLTISVFFVPSDDLTDAEFTASLSYYASMGGTLGAFAGALGGLSSLGGQVHRVAELLEQAQAHRSQCKGTSDWASSVSQQQRQQDQGPVTVALQDISVRVPDGSGNAAAGVALIKNLNLAVSSSKGASHSLVVTGPSGCGKTSLLRVMAGLWEPATGSVIRRGWRTQSVGLGGGVSVLFLPQKAYCTEGTLMEQVTYPSVDIADGATTPGAQDDGSGREDVEERVLCALKQVKLSYLVGRWGLHHACRWDGVLSGGELQRLGFARLL